ncbi:nucleoside hydrolase-like domain-containing protein [Pollutibacter soli]|uniref:nucleoside hydrolase-like domain-containing protein n=1 Tax=Pollutibacter soli TaxID=3034157 RepID=UPI0030133E2B
MRLSAIVLVFSVYLLYGFNSPPVSEKRRVLVLSDIEADPDDAQSLIRFLLYSNQWDVEGLIATTSIHQKTFVAPESIIGILDAYKKVHPNLLKHEKGYPSYEVLRPKVKKGLAIYGMEGVGEGKDSEGSEWIIKVLEKPDPRPLWVPVWGGPNTLAQALWKIKKTKSEAEAEKMIRKLRVYTISDQDDSGPWIRKNFPDLFYVVTPGYNYTKATWLGIAFGLPGSNTEVVSNDWLAKNIQQGHGPLGAAYPDVAYGMEGDTPSFLSLIDNGLSDPEHPDYGGWGGRYEYYLPDFEDSNTGMFKRENWPKDEPETRKIWTNAKDSVQSPLDKKYYVGNRETIWRWRVDFQNDFAARMAWTTKEFNQANHPPQPKLKHSERLTMKSGESIRLSAAGTTDPDGDSMSYLWFQYPEAGTYPGIISFRPYSPNLYEIPFTAPVVQSQQSIHIILKVTDKGSPALSRYKRIIVTVVP